MCSRLEYIIYVFGELDSPVARCKITQIWHLLCLVLHYNVSDESKDPNHLRRVLRHNWLFVFNDGLDHDMLKNGACLCYKFFEQGILFCERNALVRSALCCFNVKDAVVGASNVGPLILSVAYQQYLYLLMLYNVNGPMQIWFDVSRLMYWFHWGLIV